MEVYDVGFSEGRQFGDVEACIGYGDGKEILPAEEIIRPDNQSFPEESAFLLPVFAYRDHLFRLAFLMQTSIFTSVPAVWSDSIRRLAAMAAPPVFSDVLIISTLMLRNVLAKVQLLPLSIHKFAVFLASNR